MTDISRLDALEMRIVHQDETIEELNATVMEQWKLIEKLQRQIERMEESAGSSADAPPAHQPPPHY
ncbi:SlyX family protein [Hirschia maritima]|uniref:SlyX family protein n=1 Tax=Hirschia maritima TaxID=1121961 RepID=UPI00037C4811|nr:SlyX family protein [Hirschia maritima]